jgi:NDP-sugar pyrophosphorylase family protein
MTTEWPALVLTAGLGTRLHPLSDVRAKPAIPVAGRPLVCRILAWLASHDVRDVVLNLHHRPDTITSVVGDAAFGMHVRYSWENPVLGSAGGPRHALALLGAPQFFVVNGDTLTDVDLAALAHSHRASGARVTMALVPHADAGHYGGVNLDGTGAVAGFARRGTPSGYHFVGIQAVDANAFAGLPDNEPAETVSSLYPRMLRDRPGCIRGFVCGATFHDIGTPHDYLLTSLTLARQERCPLPLVGRNCRIAPSASVTDCVLWDDVIVEEGAHLRECILADRAHVPANARFERAALVPAGAGRTLAAAGEEIVGSLVVRCF